jgi:Protein of unknown function (DUF2917)
MAVKALQPKTKLLRPRDGRERSQRCLNAQEIERLDEVQPGDTIVCTNGVLWVTQEGDPADYLLQMGGRFTANGDGMVLVQALDDCGCRWYVHHYTLNA